MQKRQYIVPVILIAMTVLPLCLGAQQKYQLDSVVGNWSHYNVRVQVAQQEYNAETRFLVVQNDVSDEGAERDEGTRHTTRYDERGNELEQVSSYWNAVKGKWVEREKRVRTYDDNDRMLSYAEYEMRGEKWIGRSKTTRNFQDRVFTTIEYRGENEYWVPIHKNIGVLNEYHNDVLMLNYQWDSIGGDWVYWMKHENTFLKDTLLKESTTYTWKDGQWANQEKIEYKYRTDIDKMSDRVVYKGTDDGWQYKYLTQKRYYDAVEREESFCWSQKEEEWRAENFKESYIDQQERVTDFVLFLWNAEEEGYSRHVQGMTVYDEEDRITLSREVRYDEGKVDYGVEMRYDFDKDGNLYQEVRRVLVPVDGWVVQETKEFTFNKDIVYRDDQGEVLVFDKGHIGYEERVQNKHAIDTVRRYRYLDGKKELQEQSRYYYSRVQECQEH